MFPTDFDRAWLELHPAFRRCLELAYQSLAAGGLAVGSVITDATAEVIACGRNRAYDPPGGDELLQGTPLAHAEMNALATIRTDLDLGNCVLWSTQQPCFMCAAAISFSGVGAVRFMAADPAFVGAVDGDRPPDANGPSYEGPADDRWIVTANLLFLHNIARTHGPAGSIVAANQHVEPETTGLVFDVVSEGLLTGAALHGQPLPATLPTVWGRILEAAAQRRRRLDRS
jgi:tRNA(Arg) A34 adenosine deaminase TadA